MKTLTRNAIDAFKAALRGQLIEPGDGCYESACQLYNANINRQPGAIARCSDVTDVMTAVRFARENNVLVAVRGGGHNGAGFGSCNDGLVIDLSQIRGVRVKPGTRRVRVAGGETWGGVDHVTHSFGLAVPSGIISTTGVGGLTLGGGHGYLARKYGLTIDSLIEADVVLADGRLVRASATENEDLFWAIRGGGGNFGVVTSFVFEGRPVHTVFAGPTLWPLDKAAEVLRWYREFLPNAPEDLYGFFAFLKIPPGPPFPEELHRKTMCAVVWCYTGPQEETDRVFEPIRQFGPPVFALLGPMPYPTLNSMFDSLMPPGLQWYWKGDFFNEITDQAIALHLEHAAKIPSLISTAHFYPVDGAAARVGKSDTAFSHRGAKWSMVIAGIDPDPANCSAITGWAKDYWKALHPFSAGGAYVNFMMDEGQDRVRSTYRDNYDRLVAIKKKFDPINLFRVNQNIKP